ncbi:hypothetical protein SAMN04488029_2694 [Reichenbachiella faecimaris]|uniref:Uncharacterized protein n=1 Tax=Reichenbachiella faecimaris TaxID=692418 RepID=A0A1W2GI87_REIFA|nr:hypothetical protein SAMN04488029_2694 [Reichenbachiella faecimaris]
MVRARKSHYVVQSSSLTEILPRMRKIAMFAGYCFQSSNNSLSCDKLGNTIISESLV